MSSASWTKVTQPKDFVHVWTCLDFTIPNHRIRLESTSFYDDQKFPWKLFLNLDNSEDHIGLAYMSSGQCGRVLLTPVIHFLDKHGRIFEQGYQPETPVEFGDTSGCKTWWHTLKFDLNERLECLLHNGNLRIQLRMLKSPVQQSVLGSEVLESNAPFTLSSDLNLIFQNATFSDVSIRSGMQTFPAHKAILAGRSPVFKAMLEAPMKEAETNCIRIDDFSPEIVRGMLKYLYSDDVTVVTPALAPEFIQIADFYSMDKLKSEAESILSKNLTEENAAEVLTQAITYRLDRLKSYTIDYIVRKNVAVADSPELERYARENLPDFLELAKDDRLSTKVSELISIATKVARSLQGPSPLLAIEATKDSRKRKLSET